MEYLIDGHNLIAQMPDISLDDPDDEVKLILRLRQWAAAKRGRKVTVFFDGGLPGGREEFLSNQAVSAVFASPGTTADELLINRIRRALNPAEYALVSSDGAVKKAAAMRKIRTISARAMASQLVSAPAKNHNSPNVQPLDRESEPDEQEIAEWLEIFGGDRDKHKPEES